MENVVSESFANTVDNLFSSVGKLIKNSVAKAASGTTKDSTYLKGSISNYTKDLIMTFPMLCDDSLPPSTASMISRANEKNIVTMLEMLFASMSLSGENGVEVLSQIHKNISSNPSIDDVIDVVDNYVDKFYNESSDISERELKLIIKEMVEDLKIPKKSFPVESLNERSLNDYNVYNVHGNIVVKERLTTVTDDQGNQIPVLSYDDAELNNLSGNDLKDAINRLNAQRTRQQMQDADAERLSSTKSDKNQIDQANLASYQTSVLSKQLFDQDIKKANELQPTLLIVRYFLTDDSDKKNLLTNQKSFISGVKSRLIGVDSIDIIERLIAKNKTKVNFLNFIRATTGEIKLFRDFILCVDQAKIDSKNASKKGDAARMWKVLENRSSKNFIKKNGGKNRNDASAITTLVINQETANMMKKQYGFDIEKISNARMIMDSYNLLGLFIADESMEVVKSIYAGNDQFEQQAYSFIQRETSDEKLLKKTINLIGKSNAR